MSINKMDKIKETFTHINDNWKEEGYRKCLVEWKQIQPFISKEKKHHIIVIYVIHNDFIRNK